MSFRKPHDIHIRRRGRNIAVGLMLVAIIGIVFGLTVVKVQQDSFSIPNQSEEN